MKYKQTRSLHGGISREVEFETFSKEMKEFAQFLTMAKTSRVKANGVSPDWHEGAIAKTSTVGTNASAGFWVPGEYSQILLEKIFEDSYWLQNAMIFPMMGDFISANQLVQIFGSSPSYDSGIDFSFEATENATKTENTNPTFQLRDFRSKKMRGLQKISRDLISDAPAFMSWMTNRLAIAAARFGDSKVWRGNGNTEPLGFLNAAGVQTVTRTTAARFKPLTDGVGMDKKIDPAFGSDLTWLMNKATNAEIPIDVDTVGQPKVTTIWGDMASPLTRQRALFGYPVQITQHASTLGTSGDVVLADPKSYAIAQRQGVEIEVNSDEFWSSDIVAIMVRSRWDGQPVYPDGICKLV